MKTAKGTPKLTVSISYSEQEWWPRALVTSSNVCVCVCVCVCARVWVWERGCKWQWYSRGLNCWCGFCLRAPSIHMSIMKTKMKPWAAIYNTHADTCTDMYICTHTYTDTQRVKDGQKLISVDVQIMGTAIAHKQATKNNYLITYVRTDMSWHNHIS